MSDAHKNALGQPIGFPVPDWTPRPRPPRTAMEGRYCRLEPADPARHATDLHAANMEDTGHRIWTYLPYGPFESETYYRAWMEKTCLRDDPLFHTVIALPAQDGDERPVGIASYLRIDPNAGSIEVGHINYAPALQKTRAATEAMFLMMKRAFDELGYRRYEWKCDALNAPSCAAAVRLGLTWEGIFRQATVYKNRNRDTAWYAATDADWPALKAAFETWLDPANFDADGRQKRRLSELTAAALKS